MDNLPQKKELAACVLEVLQEHSPMTTSEIDAAVIDRLQISEAVLKIKDASYTGSMYSYQMRWVRTVLKREGKIANPRRGVWKLI